jgi:hypothetical protein
MLLGDEAVITVDHRLTGQGSRVADRAALTAVPDGG